MNYYKVVDPSFPPLVIDTNNVNYGLCLENAEAYLPLLTFATKSSLELGLPLDFYLLLHNGLTEHGSIYLKERLPMVDNGVLHLSHLVNARYETDFCIEKKDLFGIILQFNQIGYFNFEGGNYLWELIFEQVRTKKHPHLPGRRESFFLFGSIEDCRYYLAAPNKAGVIRQVTLIETRALISGDMRIFDDVPSHATAEQALAQADRYWSGERSDRPVIEYLFQGVCTVDSGLKTVE